MRVAAVVEVGWDPASIELGPAGGVDWSRAVPAAVPGSLEAVELGLSLGQTAVFGLGGAGPARAEALEGLLRTCLAMGAAGATRARAPGALAAALRAGRFDLVLTPHRSADHGPSPLAPALAALLDLPQATAVERLRLDGGEAVVVRRLDRGEREEVAVPLPAVLAVEPGVAAPRAASPAALVAARSAAVGDVPEPADPGPPGATLTGHVPPRPAPPRLLAPDPALPAEARIAAVVGDAAAAPRRELVSGPAEEVAERIARLLRELDGA
jgi:electron transfer flavoprotein beta subunit